MSVQREARDGRHGRDMCMSGLHNNYLMALASSVDRALGVRHLLIRYHFCLANIIRIRQSDSQAH
jgi:hypothetical protein